MILSFIRTDENQCGSVVGLIFLCKSCLLFFTAGLSDANNGDGKEQCFNPAFVHAIAVPEIDMLDKSDKVCVVARGDGAVDVINIGGELATMRSKGSRKPQKGSQSRSKEKEIPEQNGWNRMHLDYSSGGHTAAVSCV